MYGKRIIGAIRTTVVIDEQGRIVSAAKVRAEGNAQSVLDRL